MRRHSPSRRVPTLVRTTAVVAGLALLVAMLGWPDQPPTRADTGNSVTTPDDGGDVGESTSLALDASGNPVISYHDATRGDLKVMHCNDPNCTGDESGNITIPDTAGDVGWWTSLVLDSSGNPVVSYRDNSNGDLKVLHCGNPDCSSGNSVASVDTGTNAYFTSLALDASGNPVVSYADVTFGTLKVLHCGDANCTSGNSITAPDSGGFWSSLKLDASGNPVVSHYGGDDDLRVLHCDDPNCSGDESSNVSSPETVGDVGWHSSLALDGVGNPVVAYYDNTNFHLKVLHCDDPDCAGDESSNITSPATSTVAWYTSLVLDGSGNPIVSYFGVDNDLMVLHCNDPNCAGGEDSITASDTAGVVGLFTSLGLDGSGNPVISYRDGGNGNLKLLHCNDGDCAGGDESIATPDDGGDVGRYTSLALDDSGNPFVSYYDATTDDLMVLHCNDPNCAGDESGDITSPDTAGDVGWWTSLALDASGYPVVSYLEEAGAFDNLKVMHCNDPDCAGDDESIASPDSVFVGYTLSMILDGSGNPVVAYGTYDVKLLHCGNPDCTSGNSITTPDASGSYARWFPSLELDGSGYPVVSYWEGQGEDLRILHCNDPDCAGGDDSITSPDTGGDVGRYSSLALDASGNPVVSYFDNTNGRMKVMHCNDPYCAGNDESITWPDTECCDLRYSSLALDGDGNPVVSYKGINALRILHCNDPNCAGGDESSVSADTGDEMGAYSSLALDGSGNPVVSYYDDASGNLKLLHCGDPDCTEASTATPTPTPTATATPGATATPCPDNDADTICDGDDPDDDNDGCSDEEEVALGSVFDSYAWYDVYDVPVPAFADPQPNGPRNKVVGIGDVLAVLFYAFAVEGGSPNANGVDYDSDKGVDTDGDTVADVPPDGVADGLGYDRSPGPDADPVTGVDPAGEPNGVIDIGDVLAVLAQALVVDCTAGP